MIYHIEFSRSGFMVTPTQEVSYTPFTYKSVQSWSEILTIKSRIKRKCIHFTKTGFIKTYLLSSKTFQMKSWKFFISFKFVKSLCISTFIWHIFTPCRSRFPSVWSCFSIGYSFPSMSIQRMSILLFWTMFLKKLSIPMCWVLSLLYPSSKNI